MSDMPEKPETPVPQPPTEANAFSPPQAPWYPPPAYPPAPAAVRRSYTKLIVVIVVIVAVLCGGAIVGGIMVIRGLAESTSTVQATAEEYLDDLQAGDYNGAYGQLCQLARSQITEAQFATAAKAKPLGSYRIVYAFSQVGTRGASAYVDVEMTPEGGTMERRRIELVREGDQWKMCRGF